MSSSSWHRFPQPLGIVDVLVTGQATEDGLAKQTDHGDRAIWRYATGYFLAWRNLPSVGRNGLKRGGAWDDGPGGAQALKAEGQSLLTGQWSQSGFRAVQTARP